MENRYEIRYDEIIPRTSCTDRSNGCTIIPLAHYPNTRDRQPCATLTRHGGRMLATDATTSSASKSPPSLLLRFLVSSIPPGREWFPCLVQPSFSAILHVHSNNPSFIRRIIFSTLLEKCLGDESVLRAQVELTFGLKN